MTANPATTYEWLMESGGRGDPFDRHVFACVVAAGLGQSEQSLWNYLGLPPSILRLLMAAYFPAARIDVPGHAKLTGEVIEEEDFRALLLSHRNRGVPEEEWLAAVLARRSQGIGHLWEDLGLTGRDDLNRLIKRHFPTLFARNDKNMKWKKFFYRMMCEMEGLTVCKSPNCEQCPDVKICFEAESNLLRRVG
ncbi:MAG TPA: nitrogen fixation protein NifQ [Patescibacteria group bacterium]|nr:nitrogen fixation protein NifQ [Patescibacteria group bacterium]